MPKKYKNLKKFQEIYKNIGPYHYSADGFKKWFLEDNYRAIAKECEKANRVLDLACGEGRLGKFITCNYLAGIDNSKEAIVLNRKFYPDLYDDLYVGDMRFLKRIPLKEKVYDYIICSLSLMYILRQDLDKVLKDVNNLLANSGSFIITYPTVSIHRQPSPEADELKPNQLQKKLIKVGFKVRKIYPICPLLPEELVELANQPQQREAIYQEYLERKKNMSLENSYHFLCRAEK